MPTAASDNAANKAWSGAPARLKGLVKTAVSAALLGLIAYKAPVGEAVASVRGLSLGAVLAVVALTMACSAVAALRWKRALAVLGSHQSWTALMRDTLVAGTYNMLLPTSIGGDVVRALRCARRLEQRHRAWSSVLFERLLGLLAMALLSVPGLLMVPGKASGLGIVVAVVAAASVGALVIAHAPFQAAGRLLSSRAPSLAGAGKAIAADLAGPFAMTRSRAEMLGWSLLYQLVALSILAAVVLDWGQPRLLGAVLGAVPLALIGAMAPVSIAGLGVREGLFVLLLGRFGVSTDQALALALVWLGSSLVMALAGAVVLALEPANETSAVRSEEQAPESQAHEEQGSAAGRLVKALKLETRWATAAFWSAVAIEAAAFVLCRYPPMVDYPQHVAMGAVLRRMMDGSSGASLLYETNLLTYNAGVEVAIAALSLLMSPELAGRLLLGLHVVTFALGVLLLCEASGRPRWYALLCLPLVFGYAAGWGFANYVMAVPLALIVVAMWIRWLDGHHQRWRAAVIVLLSMMIAYTHVLAMLCVCVAVAVLALVEMTSENRGELAQRAGRVVRAGVLLVPSVGYSLVAWFWARSTSRTVWENSWAEGQDDPAWRKLWQVLSNAAGNFADASDQKLLAASVVLAIVLAVWGRRAGWDRRMRWLALVFFALYVVVPNVFIATFFIYPRFLVFAGAFAIAALPVVPKRALQSIGAAAAAVAVLTAGNVMGKFLSIEGVDDALAIIDDAPAGRRLLGVTYDVAAPSMLKGIWVHLPALYQVRRRGEVAYTFMRNESVPVHYRPGREPPRPPGGFEWYAELYKPDGAYAGAYDLVLVRSARRGGEPVDPAPKVFGAWASQVRLLSQRGRFYLYDTSALGRGAGDWP